MPKPKLTPKQARIVKAKVAGKSQRDIGLEVYPNATPGSASVLVSRELKKVNVQEAIQEEMARQGITLEQVVAPVAKALKAKIRLTSLVDGSKVEIDADDIDMQLKGHDRAVRLLGIGKQESGTVNVNFINVASQDKDAFGL